MMTIYKQLDNIFMEKIKLTLVSLYTFSIPCATILPRNLKAKLQKMF